MDVSSFFQVLAQLVLWRFYTSFLARDLRDSRSSSRLKSLCILNPTKATGSEDWRLLRLENIIFRFYVFVGDFSFRLLFTSIFCVNVSLINRVFLSFSAVQMSHISYIHVNFCHQCVYYELTKWSAPRWLDSSVGRALHQCRRGHGSNPVQAWIFFRLWFSQLLELSLL